MALIHPFDANPGIGEVPLFDKAHSLLAVVCIPWFLVCFAFRRISSIGKNDVPFLQDIGVTLLRGIVSLLPLSVLRAAELPDASKILDSPRFKDSNLNLYEYVRTPKFSGVWICQGAPGKLVSPAACEKVIYYIHGGGYTSGSPAMMMTTLLRIAEIASVEGTSISVFSLDYSLSPEARFPIPLNQAVAGYEYLLQDVGVDASKVAILGVSAGGHLGLCLASTLFEKRLPAPGAGIFLVSPWIDMLCSTSGSYVRNKDKDFIDAKSLAVSAKTVLNVEQNNNYSHLANLITPLRNGRCWKKILPCKVWISVGGHEIFHDDIVRFADVLRKEGVDTDLDVTDEKMHVWQNVSDQFDEKKYLKTSSPSNPDGGMLGAANIARAILSC